PLMSRRPPSAPLMPYTTLFRSLRTREVGQRVDRALEDVSGGERIDLLGAFGAADIGLDHCPLDRLRRPAFVPQQQRKIERGEIRSEEHTSELQSLRHLVCRLLL